MKRDPEFGREEELTMAWDILQRADLQRENAVAPENVRPPYSDTAPRRPGLLSSMGCHSYPHTGQISSSSGSLLCVA